MPSFGMWMGNFSLRYVVLHNLWMSFRTIFVLNSIKLGSHHLLMLIFYLADIRIPVAAMEHSSTVNELNQPKHMKYHRVMWFNLVLMSLKIPGKRHMAVL